MVWMSKVYSDRHLFPSYIQLYGFSFACALFLFSAERYIVYFFNIIQFIGNGHILSSLMENIIAFWIKLQITHFR